MSGPRTKSAFGKMVILINLVPLVSTFAILVSFTTMMTLYPPHKLSKLFHIVELPLNGRLFIFAIAVLNLTVCWLAERHLVPKLLRLLSNVGDKVVQSRLLGARHFKIPKWQRSGKKFKIIQNEFYNQ
jgi:hypothetical protein